MASNAASAAVSQSAIEDKPKVIAKEKVLATTKSKKLKCTKSKPHKSGLKNTPTGQSSSTWWQALGCKSKQEALDHYYATDREKGYKMTGKCFASRLYHKLDHDMVLRAQAHKDALAHCTG